MKPDNPYEPATSISSSVPRRSRNLLLRPINCGVAWSIFSAFPLTAVIACFFRFPAPLIGIGSGPQHILSAIVGLFVYGLLFGGFGVLAVTGAINGAIAYFTASSLKSQLRLARGLSILTTLFWLLGLATLDLYFGAW